MEPYIQSLLSRINDHLPPSNLATHLQPFILLDTASEKYVSIDRNLNLIILQKLDFLLSKEKQPNMLNKATTLLSSLKKRSRSKWIIGLFFSHPFFNFIYFLVLVYKICKKTQVPYYNQLLCCQIVIYAVCLSFIQYIYVTLYILCPTFFCLGAAVNPTVIKIVKLFLCFASQLMIQFNFHLGSVLWIKC